MKIIICGKSASGKSTLANELVKRYMNAVHLDIDKVSHYVLTLEEVKQNLIKTFGSNVVEENKVNRKILGNIVFSSDIEMQKLTDITWQAMEKEIDKFIANNEDKVIILDWILLPKTKYFEQSDIRILLDIPYEIRKQRALLRDGISDKDFALRDSSSIEYDIAEFDYVINNNSKENIRKLVSQL